MAKAPCRFRPSGDLTELPNYIILVYSIIALGIANPLRISAKCKLKISGAILALADASFSAYPEEQVFREGRILSRLRKFINVLREIMDILHKSKSNVATLKK